MINTIKQGIYRFPQKFLSKTNVTEMNILKKQWLRWKFRKITLSSGQSAAEYVMGLPEHHRAVAAKSILECLRLDYPLNNMEITCMGRELNRKRLGII